MAPNLRILLGEFPVHLQPGEGFQFECMGRQGQLMRIQDTAAVQIVFPNAPTIQIKEASGVDIENRAKELMLALLQGERI